MKRILLLFFAVFFLLNGCSSLKRSKNNKKLDSGEYSFIRGMNYYQKGNTEKAMEEYLKAYEKTPKNPMLLKEIGLLYGENNNIDNAIGYFEKAYKINNKDIDTMKNLSFLYYIKENYKKSNEFLDKIGKILDNQDDFLLKMRGYIFNGTGDNAKAFEYLSQIDESQYDKEYYNVITKVYLKLDKTDELHEKYIKDYDKHKDKKDFMIQYAKVKSEVVKNNKEAIVKLLQHISIYGGDDDLYLMLSQLYVNNNELHKAKSSFSLVSESSVYKEEYKNLKNILKQ
ncbi:tetratricopeptide repeat protein [Fusobacterium sp. PH5-44]|uniref:tetratricopeptide repeat protein n=1 Tax=unclassified Fusobacterium TaxID=2648384 RepID=UPI003D23C101